MNENSKKCMSRGYFDVINENGIFSKPNNIKALRNHQDLRTTTIKATIMHESLNKVIVMDIAHYI